MDAEYYMGDNKNQTQEDDVVTHGTKKYNNRRNKHKKKHEKIQIYRRKSYTQGIHTITLLYRQTGTEWNGTNK